MHLVKPRVHAPALGHGRSSLLGLDERGGEPGAQRAAQLAPGTDAARVRASGRNGIDRGFRGAGQGMGTM
jgi:hypothetical protein